jgi:hypothetical protein
MTPAPPYATFSALPPLFWLRLAVASLLCGGRFGVLLNNLGCVFILGGVVLSLPLQAVGRVRLWRLPKPKSALILLQPFQAQLDGGFLQAIWVPRDENVRADYLSHSF